ncbi:MAG: MFS transporter, partial [Parvularculaceae bacterium]|nr:MFS transporter [Parvularculaceae bacterium]
ASALFAPRTDEAAARAGSAAVIVRALLRDKRVAGMLAASALVQGAHAAYYTFSVLHWKGLGYQPREIGALWSIGVIVEILLLWRARRLERFSGETLLFVGALGAVLRWLGVAAEPPLPLLFLVQTLHAASFALAYIGMMQFLRARVEPGLLGAAVATNSTLIAVVTGIATVAAGYIVGASGGPAAYLLMATMAAASAAMAYALRRGRGVQTAAS